MRRLFWLIAPFAVACGDKDSTDDPVDTSPELTDADGDGFFAEEDDCDDADAAVFPGAEEACDDVDQDCDALVARMATHGAEVLVPPADMFWGERFARVRDPFGHEWGIAQQLREVSDEEVRQIVTAMFEGGAPESESVGGDDLDSTRPE